ncbi:DNA topoisomerase [Lachnospiraceae bacterium 62-35]
MAKALYIAEKPSVAQEFARVLKIRGKRGDGYLESESAIVTWCVGHLITMSYPEVYDPALKRWSLSTLPFLPKEFKYQVIESTAKQFQIVSGLLNREDVDIIYICTDSGREGEYIYRLVDQMAGVQGKARKRVWIDSQTEEEILRGIREAKDWSEYNNLSASAYLRAKEDYLMGINFSRLLTLKYGPPISRYMNTERTVLSVGRVMTCVLGMVVRREREIRDFVKTPFYRVLGTFDSKGMDISGEWKSKEGSKYSASPFLYKDNGFKEEKYARELIAGLSLKVPMEAVLSSVSRKKETKNPPLLYNLAELQNDCSKRFKISPDETLRIVQELYEKKLVTYPRTDARVLSTAAAKVVQTNISGLKSYSSLGKYAEFILEKELYHGLVKTRYVNDKQITDHYAIVPTGQGFSALKSLNRLALQVYDVIARRFLSIFYPPAIYQKYSLEMIMEDMEGHKECFCASFRILIDRGYLELVSPQGKKVEKEEKGKAEDGNSPETDSVAVEREGGAGEGENGETAQKNLDNPAFLAMLGTLRKGMKLPVKELSVKEGETSPPKRYTSGSMILAMENAGQLIEDEDLRAQIKGSGIGTSATRAEILKKLVNIKYLALNGKTQVITPTLLGEIIFEVVNASLRQLLNPELTASWEKGLTYVAEGTITPEEYMEKLEHFVSIRTANVMRLNNQHSLKGAFDTAAANYQKGEKKHEKRRDENEKPL